ncbi:uncharacterized protein LOC127791591 [Diospyros lotus]|uniref:uncharacterized protein LOC127791591 n=1 Tax=Diospyros lotus TaxID=55363 RepID=UPI002250E97D|nr:uncharacterized protein LOC127791591 [Diospyros lotus]
MGSSKRARMAVKENTFSEEDARDIHWPHNDALVIRAHIGNMEVRRIMVDTGSSVNVMYRACFDQMGLGPKQLGPSLEPLFGFTGDAVVPMGRVKLPFTIGGEGREATALAEFLIIDYPSAYNVVLGRPVMNELDMVTSTRALTVKFPTTNETGCVRGEQHLARRCYEDAVKMGTRGKKVNVVTEGAQRPSSRSGVSYDLDPREVDCDKATGPVEELEEVPISEVDAERCLKLGKNLAPEVKCQLIEFLKTNLDVFAWNHEDMVGIAPEVMSHRLNIDPSYKPVRQKRRPMTPERYAALKEEVDKLLVNGFIREAHYPVWVANPVLVKKKNGKWRTCVDFTNLNKACPKDSFPLPRIDQLVDATARHQLLSFMDAYSGYNQIPMNPNEEEHTSFITDRGLYCYKVMPFGLKNAGATYQRLVNMMFEAQIGKTMEVYVDDMLVKSEQVADHVRNLGETFKILRSYNMKLNPLKCAFRVASGRFLGFMVNSRGIEANPEKIKALLDMRSPVRMKDVQSLIGQVAALSRFISKATDKCIPFFNTLRKAQGFSWSEECELAFQQLKEYMGQAPLLSKPRDGEKLVIYLGVSAHALSAALVREEEGVQYPVYYISKRLVDAETRYTSMEKLAYCLVIASRKLRPYFQAHQIDVLTKYPLRQILQKPDTSGRLLKWAIELAQFDLEYKPRVVIKGQALANFIAEFTETTQVEGETSEGPSWELYVDGSSSEQGAGAGVMLISPEGHRILCALRFGFRATNNEAEYEALLAGLRLAKEVRAEALIIFSDSQLVVNQIRGEYQAKGVKMVAYLLKVRELLVPFQRFEVHQIPRSQNSHADALARLATARDTEFLGAIPVEFLAAPSMEQPTETMVVHASQGSWMSPILAYLREGKLPTDKLEARRLRARAARYCIYDEVLYKRGFTAPLLRCIEGSDCQTVLEEIHAGHCGNHAGALSLAQKALRQGFYWPMMKQDAINLVKKCDKCQWFANIPRAPPAYLQQMNSSWPFAVWGMDLIGPLPTARGNCKHVIVVVDYFTKWAEAKELAEISSSKVQKFVWNNIICRFGVPQQIVTDNGTQFTSEQFIQFCESLGIQKSFTAVDHPQANGQVEAVNKIIKHALKMKLEDRKGAWADELQTVLWAYRTTARTSTAETPFSLVYGSEAMIPAEHKVTSQRRATFNPEGNDELLAANLDLLEEARDTARLRIAIYQQRVARYYNRKVRVRWYKLGDRVLRLVLIGARKASDGTLGPNWERPFVIHEDLGNGAYHLANMDGAVLLRAWNAEHLRPYHQ